MVDSLPVVRPELRTSYINGFQGSGLLKVCAINKPMVIFHAPNPAEAAPNPAEAPANRINSKPLLQNTKKCAKLHSDNNMNI